MIESLGLVLDEQIDAWRRVSDLDAIRLWLALDSEPSSLVRSFTSLDSSKLPLLAALTIEARMATAGAEVGSYLRSSGSSFAAAIVDARWTVAHALRRQVYSVRFSEPVILARAANLAATAFESLVPFADESNPERTLARIQRQVGRLVVTAARFSTGDVSKLETALGYLVSASTDPDDISTAVHRIEASLELYHATGDKSFLTDAAQFISSRRVPRDDWPAWHLIVAEIWLNLADHATTTGRSRFLEKADESFAAVDAQGQIELRHEIRCAMFKALRTFVGQRASKLELLRGVRLPFALRTPRDLPEIVYEATPELIRALRFDAERGQYQYREFLAELESRVARNRTGEEAAALLQDAIRLRGPIGTKKALDGARDQLAQAQDLLLLAQLKNDPTYRSRGLDILLRRQYLDSSSSEPIVIIANEIEAHGPSSITSPTSPPDLMDAIRVGDHTALFAMAAARALNNPALRVSGLGGRGGGGETYTVDDFSGITGQTFVFKRTSQEALSRDEARARFLAAQLENHNETTRFGVIEHIGTLSVSQPQGGASLVSVRRYVRGRTLRSALVDVGTDRLALLRRSARFLGLIHGWEARAVQVPGLSRNQIKEKELGRWLKKLAGEEKLSLFNSWWELVSPVDCVPRRDAHSLNWLVNDDQRVLAVDLEATGARPLTYELAQLVDDHPALAPADWSSRELLLREYLGAAGIEAQPSHLVAYQASSAARAVGLLTDEKATEQQRNHAYELLLSLSTQSANDDLRRWCRRVLDAWAVKTGLADPTRYTSIQPDDRVRISKAMSYHLRHDPVAQTTRGGWMFVEDLAEVLQANGHNVTPEQLLVVAGALGEPRFQLDGREIRAAYGHSVARRTDYEASTPPGWLYHATPTSSMQSIFEARAGLRPMGRQMVHLSTDPIRALQTAQRHSPAAHLLRVRGKSLPELVKAAEDTWLIPFVPAGELEVTTIIDLARFELEARSYR
ncbi:RNA 2'-phosphotransferase [Leifsonia xyli]|uniref:RNA 2'-phosphotransferase n=1 Tax=Leifsonia xyli TaxID=1575 RepID=UPI003D67EC53